MSLSKVKLERRTMANWLTLLDIANGSIISPYISSNKTGIYASIYILRIPNSSQALKKALRTYSESESQKLERETIEICQREKLSPKVVLNKYFNIPNSQKRSEKLVEILNSYILSLSAEDKKRLLPWYQEIIQIALNKEEEDERTSSSCCNSIEYGA